LFWTDSRSGTRVYDYFTVTLKLLSLELLITPLAHDIKDLIPSVNLLDLTFALDVVRIWRKISKL